MFTVYAEKNIFENIILFNDVTPNWNSIFCNHADVCLNITKKELEKEQVQGSIIFEFIQANGGREPIPLSDFFESINDDPSIMLQKPRSVFFLNIGIANAKKLQSDYGLMVQCGDSIDDSLLTGTAFRELLNGTILESEHKIGWNSLMNFSKSPSNSMVITDDWLFRNEVNSQLIGEQNLIKLIDSLLPETLKIDYQILIITQDHDRPRHKCEQLAGRIIAKIKTLRKYEIRTEIVFAETLHKRKVFLNYMSITCDKGFAMFNLNDDKTVRGDNDFRYEKIFERNLPGTGDSVYESDSLLLHKIHSICNSAMEYIKNKGQDSNKRIFGDSNSDKSIRNRLLNDV